MLLSKSVKFLIILSFMGYFLGVKLSVKNGSCCHLKVHFLNDVYMYSEKYGAQFLRNIILIIYICEKISTGDLPLQVFI